MAAKIVDWALRNRAVVLALVGVLVAIALMLGKEVRLPSRKVVIIVIAAVALAEGAEWIGGAQIGWIGAIPVHKPSEQKGPVTNDQMFASCYEALRASLPPPFLRLGSSEGDDEGASCRRLGRLGASLALFSAAFLDSASASARACSALRASAAA